MKKITLCSIILITMLSFSASTCKNNTESGFIPNLNDFYVSRFSPAEPMPFNDITAAELVAGMTIGWNLGNTLDATDGKYYGGSNWLRGSNASVSRMETAWGNPVTTKANFDALKNAGFNTVRIPVSWSKTVNSNFIIRNDWMDRVTEIVNYAVENDMYIIINTHHDEDIFMFTEAEKNASLRAFEIIWGQIANNFKNYNEKLIFEGLNEPRTKGSPAEWRGGTGTEHDILNEHYEVFVRVVRNSGGNNDRRKLMINTYAASAEQIAMDGLRLPADTAENKLIVSIHAYSPYNFALNQGAGATAVWSRDNSRNTADVRTPLDRAYNTFVSKGYPVIMGEFGAVDRGNEDARAEWAEYYVSYAKSKEIPCVLWDNGGFSGSGELFGFLDRRTNTFPHQKMLAAFMKGIQ